MVAVLLGPTMPGPAHNMVLVAEFGATESCVVGLVQVKLPVEEMVGVNKLLPFNTVNVDTEVLIGHAPAAVDEQVYTPATFT